MNVFKTLNDIFRMIMKSNKGLTSSAILALIATSACSSNYVEPQPQEIAYQNFIEKESFTVWDSMVKKLSAAGFNVRKLDKNSGTMNLVYKSKKPGEFVDCGIYTTEAYEERKIRSLSYNPADSALFSNIDDDDNIVNVVRSSDLEAKASIFLAPNDDGTNVRINVKYDIKGRTKYYDQDNKFSESKKFTYKLSSNGGFDNGNISCVSKGVIERQILDAAL